MSLWIRKRRMDTLLHISHTCAEHIARCHSTSSRAEPCATRRMSGPCLRTPWRHRAWREFAALRARMLLHVDPMQGPIDANEQFSRKGHSSGLPERRVACTRSSSCAASDPPTALHSSHRPGISDHVLDADLVCQIQQWFSKDYRAVMISNTLVPVAGMLASVRNALLLWSRC